MPGGTWTEGTATLAPGDGVVVFSDGILDLHADPAAVDAALVAAMAGDRSADEVADRLVAPATDTYREDDVTVVVVRRSR